MLVSPFGHMSHAGRDAPDAAELAEEPHHHDDRALQEV